MSNLFRSLFVSLIFCFIMPCVIFSLILGVFSTLTCIPDLAQIGDAGIDSINTFLTVFGGGYPLEGILIIGMACSTVGGLFDLYNFYLYQGVKS